MSANPTVILLRSRRVTECDLVKLRSERSLDKIRNELDASEALCKRASTLVEAQRTLLGGAPNCKGKSCHGSRLPCSENCNPVPEMSVYVPDDDNAARIKSEGEALWLLFLIFAFSAAVVAAATYMLWEPITTALGRVLN